MNITAMIITAAHLVLASPNSEAPKAQSVMLSASETDPCAYGAITGAGKGSVIVFDAPNVEAQKIDYLADDDAIWVCDSAETKDGAMMGIVYSVKGVDCDVSSPVKATKPYDGACKTGWVREEYIAPLAG